MRVAAAPEKGKANDALIQFLAPVLGVRRDAITIVGGLTGRDKLVEVAGATHAHLAARLAEAAKGEQ